MIFYARRKNIFFQFIKFLTSLEILRKGWAIFLKKIKGTEALYLVNQGEFYVIQWCYWTTNVNHFRGILVFLAHGSP